MDDEEFIRAARVLSSDHGLPILRVLSDDQWKIASEISSHLDIHTSTASKYLVLLHGRGLLDRRTRKTGRRSTYEYHLKRPTIMLEVDLSGGRDLKALDCWDACLALFHRIISAANDRGFPGIDDSIDDLLRKLERETGIENLSLFGPKCDIGVAKRLVRKRMADGQLNADVSYIKDVCQIVFDSVKKLCIEKIGGRSTEELFRSAMSESDGENGRVVRELGLTGTFKRGFANA
ncbi:MAG: hypothetical protein V3U09_05210 [Thermoplasmata archaeon]